MTPLNLSTPSQPNQSLLCALCLSAPLRETKRRRERRRTASGNRCKAVVSGSGRGEGHLRRGTSRRGAERQRAQSGRLTRESRRHFKTYLVAMDLPLGLPLNLTPPLNPINLCALCLSAPLRETKRRRERRRTASGNRCKAVVGGSGREREGRGTPQEGDLTQRRGEAESAERKVETTMGNERAGDISKRILSPWTSRLDCLSTSRPSQPNQSLRSLPLRASA